MFRDERVVRHIATKLLRISNLNALKARQKEYKTLLDSFYDEVKLLVSMSLNIKNPMGLKTKHNNYKTDKDHSEILGEAWYYYYTDNLPILYRYVYSLPMSWQTILHMVFSKSIITSITEDYVLESLDTYYTNVELMYHIVLPEVIEDEELEVQTVTKKQGELIFPVYTFMPHKAVNINKLEFLLDSGGRQKSSSKQISVRKEIKNALGFGRYGCLFYTSKKVKYKYKRNISILVKSSVEVIKNILKGLQVNFEDIEPIYPHTVLNNKQEFFEFVKKNHRRHIVVIGSGGVLKATPLVTYRTAKIVDYITNEDYEPIGVVASLDNQEYRMFFDVTKTDLIHGIKDRFVKLQIKTIEGELVDVSFNSVPSAWSTDYACCRACGEVISKHKKDGVCSSCCYKLEKEILRSTFGSLENCMEFSITLNTKDHHEDTCLYDIAHKDHKTVYVPVKGQTRLKI